MPYFKQDNPFIVPTTDGKLIEEHFGLASTKTNELSIAHMLAPSGWSEPYQNPEFDEYTLVSRGKKLFDVDRDKVIVSAGESILVKKGTRVQYSNPLKSHVNTGAFAFLPFQLIQCIANSALTN